MTAPDLTPLRGAVAGDVVGPADAGYGLRRRTFVATGSPAAVVRCRTPQDVAAAVGFAREHALPLAVRSGGHGTTGFGTCDGGLVVDLSPMNSVDVVDPERRLVRVDAGATWARVAAALAPRGLGLTSGDTGDVGVGGLLLGGGVGWLARKYGLALDSVVAAEVVGADGQLRRADATEHPELFWALRGGGGNVGVVTSFELVAQPVTDVVFGTVRYPVAELARVLDGWRTTMRGAPDELTTSVTAVPAMDLLVVTVCHASADIAAAEDAVRPLLDLDHVLGKDLAVRPYAGVLEDVGGPGAMPPDMRATIRSGFAPTVTDELVDALAGGVERLGSLAVDVRSLGGAVNRVPRDATAFAHRDSEALVTTVVMGPPPVQQAAVPELDRLWRELAPHVDGAYVNFLSTATADDVAAVYPQDTYRRLAAVKATYDPENVFARNHNVPPKAS